MKLLLMLLIAVILSACSDHVNTNTPAVVWSVKRFLNSTCLYETLAVTEGEAIYSETTRWTDVESTCGLFQVGDTIKLIAVKNSN